MKIFKHKTRRKTYYFFDGALRYVHYKNKKNYEYWIEYFNNEIYYKDNKGKDDVIKIDLLEETKEEDIRPFIF